MFEKPGKIFLRYSKTTPKVLELRTQAISKRTIGRVQLSLPVSLQPVLVIRPGIEQFWLNGLAPTAILDF